MLNFPLYVVRQYIEIVEEYPYKLIYTERSRYVLDVDIPDTTYAERRMRLLNDPDKPYKLYPINRRIDMVGQLLTSGATRFIDSTGKITIWKPKKFYPVVCLPIQTSWATSTGSSIIILKGLNTKFKVRNGNYKYAQVIQIGRLNLLFDLCDELRPTTRKKI